MKKIVTRLIISISLLFIPFLLLLSGNSGDSYVFILEWGVPGAGDGKFDYPCGIAVDSDGCVYVADAYNHRIQKFESDSAYITQWGEFGNGNGQFYYPSGVAVDSTGNVYASDLLNHRIQKFNSDGTYLDQWGSIGSGAGQFIEPMGVAVDSAGNVYVADRGNNRVQIFDSSGNPQYQIVGGFNEPYDVAVDSSGNIYVSDYGNHYIKKFNPNGTPFKDWGGLGNGAGQFNNPWGVAVDTNDNIYVADSTNNRIQKFESDGTYITEWGGAGNIAGKFDYPTDVAVDSNGYVYVADTGNNRIQKFAPSHIFAGEFWKVTYSYSPGTSEHQNTVGSVTSYGNGTYSGTGTFKCESPFLIDTQSDIGVYYVQPDGTVIVDEDREKKIMKIQEGGNLMIGAIVTELNKWQIIIAPRKPSASNCTNSDLDGEYWRISFSYSSTGSHSCSRGTVTFDGTGGYTFDETFSKQGVGFNLTGSGSGTYDVSADGTVDFPGTGLTGMIHDGGNLVIGSDVSPSDIWRIDILARKPSIPPTLSDFAGEYWKVNYNYSPPGSTPYGGGHICSVGSLTCDTNGNYFTSEIYNETYLGPNQTITGNGTFIVQPDGTVIVDPGSTIENIIMIQEGGKLGIGAIVNQENVWNIDVIVRKQSDTDNDGATDVAEQGPDGANINYDGNQDGIPDSQQNNVASFHTHDAQYYVTLATPSGTTLSDVQVDDNPSPGDAPQGVDFPYGFFKFTINGVVPGGATTATIYLPPGESPNTYYKYGPTPLDVIPHWHEFYYDPLPIDIGATFFGNVITLHFVDGQRGDHDLAPNGVIVEPGGPGITGGPSMLNPLEAKRNLIDELSTFLPIRDKKTGRRITKAIDHIDKSLKPDLWETGQTLTRKGKKVFDEEKKAVRELKKIAKDKISYAAVAQTAIDTLVSADVTLADYAIEKAIAVGGDAKDIAKAQYELAKTQKEINKGKFEKAIDHCKKAWEHAQKALK